MQAGMLFQNLLGQNGKGSSSDGYDIEQMHLVFAERLAKASLARAWTLVARRHPILSSSFWWEGLPQPQQRVMPDVVVTVDSEDWTGLGTEERARRRTEFLAHDRARGFDLTRAPLMRLTMFPVGPAETEVVWTFHHLLLDGRSMPTVLVEAFDAYAALARGDVPVLSPPPRPYRAFIDWLAARDHRPSLDFFRTLLRGKTAPTPLPLAESAIRPVVGTGYGETARKVDPEIADRARTLAGRMGATLGTLVQAAWALVLARTTGQDDVIFGGTRACRHSALGGDAESMVGLFINTLPVRARVDGALTVADVLAALRAQSLAVRDHEHTPLLEIQGASEIPRGTPLFETLLMFENRELNRALRAADPRWNDRRVALHEQPSPPLTVTVFDDQDLEIRILYDARRYREPVVERLAAYLATALAELSLDEHRKLAELEILPEAERRTIVHEWNRTSRPFEISLLHARFEERARLQPDTIALEAERDGIPESLTFAALDARANRLAHALVERGAAPGTFVGVCLDRGADLVVAFLAVAKSGAAYVPLDPAYPIDRIAFMLEDSATRLVVTEKRYDAVFASASTASAGISRLVVDGADAEVVARMPPTAPARTATPSDVCYVIYTSGSTGRPKGVVLTHEAVVNTFDWVSRTFDVGPGDRLLFVTSPCFDLSVYDTFGALGAGATVVVASRGLIADPEALAAAIVERRITVWDSAPAALQRLTPFFPAGSREAPLRLVMLSGDWIPLSLPDTLRQAFPRVRVMGLGGATEAAIWSNWFPVEAIDPRWSSIPYGRPIQNARYHVLDARMKPVPAGVAGDLYIGGTCLAQGYLHRPELTAERFVDDPFSEPARGKPRERLYKTGDLARYFEDGDLEFLGRADLQVKIRGYRVELGEVEAALAQAPGVRDAICVAWTDASGQKSLVGYVVPHESREGQEGNAVDAEALKAYAASRLTDFMVPSQIVVLTALPVSPNGKVDRAALPDPSTGISAADPVAPRSNVERRMAGLWQELLRRERVGVHDDFFALGGHSLLAVMLVSRVEREFGVKIRLSSVLQNPTVARLSAVVEGVATPDRKRSHLVTLRSEGKRPPLLLVSGAGGFGFCFQGVAGFVGGRHPVHVLNAIGADDEREGLERSVEEAAAIYLPEVLEAIPRGPLILGGYSFGVLVAFEIAHHLRQVGREVPLLVSFEGFAPGFPERMALPRRLLAHAKALLQGDSRTYARQRFANLRGRVLGMLGRVEDRLPPIPAADRETDRRLRRLEAALWKARGLYKPEHVWPGDLLLLKTALSEQWLGNDMDDPLYGWRSKVAGRIEVTTVAGGHHSMFEEANQRLLAEAILRSTARLEPPATSPSPLAAALRS